MDKQTKKAVTTSLIINGGILATFLAFGVRINNSAQREHQIRPVASYDINGDGVEDFVVPCPKATISPGYTVQVYDGKDVRIADQTEAVLFPGTKNFDTDVRYFAKGSGQPAHYATIPFMDKAGIVSRSYDVQPSKDKKSLDLRVTDNTADFPVSFEQIIPSVWPNPKKI